MIVHLDTSALIDALTGPRRSLDDLERLVDEGHRLTLSTIVLYEWWRGPRTRAELAGQQDLFPPEATVPFGPEEAALASRLYRELPRARGREVDLAIAACALASGAAFWTLNPADFRDIPGLRLI
jgi:predicted nucleic acid-binding protein